MRASLVLLIVLSGAADAGLLTRARYWAELATAKAEALLDDSSASYVDEVHRLLAARLGDANGAHELIKAAGAGNDVCKLARAFRENSRAPRQALEVADFVERVHACVAYKPGNAEL